MTPALLVHEWRGLARDGRLAVLLSLWAVLLAATAFVSASQQQRAAAERRTVADTLRAQWDRQGDKHPHRGAHFGLVALRPASALSGFDPGVGPAVGEALYLEPHRRNVPMFSPLADAPASARLSLPSPAAAIELLLPLITYALGFAAISAERESGRLRMLHAAGLPRRRWLFAKAGALAVVVTAAALPALVLPVLGSPAADPQAMARLAALGLSIAAAAFVHAAVAVAVSARCRSSRMALLVLLGLWALQALVLPRLAADVAEHRNPVPSPTQFWDAVAREVRDGLPGEAPLAEQLKAFEQDTLRAHGVARIEELPVGFLALRRLFRDAHADRVHERHFATLWQTYRAQQASQLAWSGANPLVAWRGVSMGLAGTHLAQEERFQHAAEAYRRDVNTRLDHWDAEHGAGRWSFEERYAGSALWQAMPAFSYAPPGLAGFTRAAGAEAGVLAGWLGLAVLLLLATARRVTP